MIRLEAAIFFVFVFGGAILLTWAGDRLCGWLVWLARGLFVPRRQTMRGRCERW